MTLETIIIWVSSKHWYDLFLLCFSALTDLSIIYIMYRILKFLEKKGP
jgi:hypothetical protein